MSFPAGERLGRYEILAPLGVGGMGEVYRARDTVLEREVAVKVLLSDVADDADRLERFEREARAVAALKHPNILDIYDFGTDKGRPFAVMELLKGRSLHDRISRDREPISWDRAAEIGSAVAAGLAAAHEKGVVHRDLKPGNIFLCSDGRIKILDFGLARLVSGATPPPIDSMDETLSRLGLVNLEKALEGPGERDGEPLTKQGTVLGTAGYMAPEQVRGQPADERSDIFALGCVLYEMVAAKNPFKRDTGVQTLNAILEEEPEELSTSGIELPPEYQTAVQKCLQKDPAARYASSSEVSETLRKCIEGPQDAMRHSGPAMGRKLVAALVAVFALVVGFAGWWWLRSSKLQWAEREALPEITRLTEVGDLYEAYRLALEAEQYIPENTELQKMFQRITLPLPIVTEPPGASVHIKGYRTPEAPWELLGETPLQSRFPYALMRIKISKEGYEDFVGAPFGERPLMALASGFPLDPEGTRPEGMVSVVGGAIQHAILPTVEIGPYWIDRFEVTNGEFKQFVDDGGYRQKSFWTEAFAEQGRKLTWEEAMRRFTDSTGRPGPATWELGAFAENHDEYPVGGVSWYEAAAYCSWAGKSLPTIYHWYGATAQDQLSDIVQLSNFGTDGPAAVGIYSGLGDFGTYDMAGNVKEWCWNATGEKRYILGGGWGEPTYTFKQPDARLPFERLPTHGFRCAKPAQSYSENQLAPVSPRLDYAKREPVTEEVYEAYRRLYAYDRTPLDAEIENLDEGSAKWRREKVSFNAAYGGERVPVLIFQPKDVPPPWQAVIWFPGDDVFFQSTSEQLASPYVFDFIPRSGRAVVYPIYKGMYERFVNFPFETNQWRDMMIMWSKDLGRTIDYLETREDIDHHRLAYYGFSSGAAYGPVFTAIDDRFKASILLSGGLAEEVPPEMDVVNFAPRCRVPTLMINGEDDFISPVEISQRPFFDLLGAPPGDKRHALLEGGHLPPDRREIIREVLDWLDRYLGPVSASVAGSTSE
jgi:tRNA A-37 threonylcarbamoyl transferase component Bud32/pimeloyl-ACP methyl ester carboxylesterase